MRLLLEEVIPNNHHKLSNKTGLISALEWFELVHPEDQTQSGDNRLNSINNPKKKQMEYRISL
jgi:hypothetical protein